MQEGEKEARQKISSSELKFDDEKEKKNKSVQKLSTQENKLEETKRDEDPKKANWTKEETQRLNLEVPTQEHQIVSSSSTPNSKGKRLKKKVKHIILDEKIVIPNGTHLN